MELLKLMAWLKSVCRHGGSHRSHIALKECDARLLRDIGLYRERGRLMPLNPERRESV
ncbi:hypothetical protein [Halomonas sp. BC04]|uniref:hypothetical protein n=1 Tax=Halomonas sp. BC04 TaxID=1403540 RepID=UPI0003ED5FFA|nr:hypothetical protein [Halomonas sp. BC04]EWH00192.1 hypothetical protein Q427_20820 [Halomonas sp. BC04]